MRVRLIISDFLCGVGGFRPIAAALDAGRWRMFPKANGRHEAARQNG